MVTTKLGRSQLNEAVRVLLRPVSLPPIRLMCPAHLSWEGFGSELHQPERFKLPVFALNPSMVQETSAAHECCTDTRVSLV